MEATKQVPELIVQTEKPTAQYARYTSEQNVMWLLASAKRALQNARVPKATIDEMVAKCLGSVYPESEYVLSQYVSWKYGEMGKYSPSSDDEGEMVSVKLQPGRYFLGDRSMITDEFDAAIRGLDADYEKLALHAIDGTNVLVIPKSDEMNADSGHEFNFWQVMLIVDSTNAKHVDMNYAQRAFNITRPIEVFISDEEDGRYVVVGDQVFDTDFQGRCYYCDSKWCDESCNESDDDWESDAPNDDLEDDNDY